jgi:outer membrane protein OmpA-like peptidoglycan-associated protein/opacity protein-like surface antigen
MKRYSTRRSLPALIAIVALAAAAIPASAAEIDGRWGVEAEGGLWKLTEGYWDHSNMKGFLGFGVRKGLSERWIGTLSYRYGSIRPGVESPSEDAGLTTKSYGTLFTEIHNPTLTFEYLLRPGESFRPYVGLGLGLTAWRVLDAEEEGFIPKGTTVLGYESDGDRYEKLQSTEFTLAAELGAEYWLSESFSMRLAARYHILPGNDLDNVGLSSTNAFDNPEYVDSNKGLLQGAVGLTYWFGGRSDADNDGLEDDRDACPRAAEDFDGFQDEDGCPDYDNDEDGVPDDVDGCPLDPEDRDGFQDEDGCPDPDNDGDGIIDARDGAPDEAEDMDGFEDEDGVPDPDNDQDGVLDAADQCPDTPLGVEVDENGCPLPEPEPDANMQAMDAGGLTLEGVTFRSGSAQILPSSLEVMQRVADSLKASPDVRVEVRGHTDATGGAETNRQLSHRRAMAVRDVLIQLGISPSRITAVGYGEDYPIASNETREGRAANRRVELHRIR